MPQWIRPKQTLKQETPIAWYEIGPLWIGKVNSITDRRAWVTFASPRKETQFTTSISLEELHLRFEVIKEPKDKHGL